MSRATADFDASTFRIRASARILAQITQILTFELPYPQAKLVVTLIAYLQSIN